MATTDFNIACKYLDNLPKEELGSMYYPSLWSKLRNSKEDTKGRYSDYFPFPYSTAKESIKDKTSDDSIDMSGFTHLVKDGEDIVYELKATTEPFKFNITYNAPQWYKDTVDKLQNLEKDILFSRKTKGDTMTLKPQTQPLTYLSVKSDLLREGHTVYLVEDDALYGICETSIDTFTLNNGMVFNYRIPETGGVVYSDHFGVYLVPNPTDLTEA